MSWQYSDEALAGVAEVLLRTRKSPRVQMARQSQIEDSSPHPAAHQPTRSRLRLCGALGRFRDGTHFGIPREWFSGSKMAISIPSGGVQVSSGGALMSAWENRVDIVDRINRPSSQSIGIWICQLYEDEARRRGTRRNITYARWLF